MEDSLSASLHSDDKEVLRERLALLQREYNRTVQRLRRAERSELVRKHVRSRIAAQNFSQEEQSGVTLSNPSVSDTPAFSSVPHSDLDVCRKGTTVQFSLPPDIASPCSSPVCLPDSDSTTNCDGSQGHRRHSAHRLRSRRSWLRWEQKEGTDSQRSGGGQGASKLGDGETAGAPVFTVHAVECQPEALSTNKETDSSDPSVAGARLGREVDKPFGGGLKDNCIIEQCESLADSLVEKSLLFSEAPEVNCGITEELPAPSSSRSADSRSGSGTEHLSQESGGDGQNGKQRDVISLPLSSDSGQAGGLSSCTMIDGLLFPVEYYVRTTRRMASAQSHVDLGAVIRSQLSRGRIGRGRRRGPAGCVAWSSQGSAAQPGILGAADVTGLVPAEPESCQTIDADSVTAKPRAGRRRRSRGRGRGCKKTDRKGCHPQSVPEPSPDLISRMENHVRTTEKEVYSVFRAKIPGFKFSEEQTGADLCRSLLLQPTSPKQPALPPVVPMLEGGTLGLRALLSHFDVKDFHLPDDEFGRLKLDKLRSSAMASQSHYNTRRGANRTSFGNGHIKNVGARRLRGAVRSDSLQYSHIEPSESAPQLPNKKRSRNGTVHKTESADRPPAGEQGRDGFWGGGTGPPVESSNPSEPEPVVKNMKGSSQVAGVGEGECRDATGLMEEGRGLEESPAGGLTAAATVRSPYVLNLSSSPVTPKRKSESFALPLLESPIFPSLGFTPAFSIHSSIPPQISSPSTTWKVQPATPSTTHWSLCSAGTPPSPLSHLPKAEAQIGSQTSLPADMEEAGGHGNEASANQRSPSFTARFSDSLSASIIGSFTSQCPHSALSPLLGDNDKDSSTLQCEADSVNTPPPQIAASRPRGKVDEPDPAEKPSRVDLVPSPSPSFSRKDENIEFSKPSAATLLSPSQNCPNAREKEALCPVKEDGGGGTLGTESQTDPKVDGTSKGYNSQLLLSQAAQSGDQDLENYFTESPWPSGGHLTGEQPEARCVGPPTPQGLPPTDVLHLTHTLKAPSGHCLVDVYGVHTEMGWSVVTAGEWAVSAWTQSFSQQWHLLYSWAFTEHPVIALLPVPDAPGLVCVTLGQLEIREARVLCLVSAGGPSSQSVLCTGDIQAVLGVSNSRVVCCASLGSTQIVTVAKLTQDGRPEESLCLVSPGQCVQALAPVEGEPDALIGSADTGRLVLWNMRTGDLLWSFTLGEGFLGTACLKGYSEGGVLFTLLQHKFLSQEDDVLFSLIATNPITALYVSAYHLSQPTLCSGSLSGRFMDVDVCESSLAVAFRCGTVATWDLREQNPVAMLAQGPEDGCNIVRWAGPSTLLTGHFSGNVSLYQYKGGDRAAQTEA